MQNKYLLVLKDVGIKLRDVNVCYSITNSLLSEDIAKIVRLSQFDQNSPLDYICKNVDLDILTLTDSALTNVAYHLLTKLSPLYSKYGYRKNERKELNMLLSWFLNYFKGKNLIDVCKTCLAHHLSIDKIFPQGKNTTNFSEISEKSNAPLDFITHLASFKDTSIGQGELLFLQILENASKIDTSDTQRGYHGDVKSGNNCIEVKFLNDTSGAKLSNTKNDVGTKSGDCIKKIHQMIRLSLVPLLEKYTGSKVNETSINKLLSPKGFNIFATRDNKFMETINQILYEYVKQKEFDLALFMIIYKTIITPFIYEVFDMVFKTYFSYVKSYPKVKFFNYANCEGITNLFDRYKLFLDLSEFQTKEFLARVIKDFSDLCKNDETNLYLAVVNNDGIIDYLTPDDLNSIEKTIEALKDVHFRLGLPCTTTAAKLSFAFSLYRSSSC